MATVPTLSPEQQVQARPVAPGYQSDAGADAAAFGGVQARSLQQSGEQIDSMSNKLAVLAHGAAEKSNAVARARDLGVFSTQAMGLLHDTTTSQDMTDPSTLQNYNKALDDLASKTVANHAGGPDSQEMLMSRIQLHRTEFVNHASTIANTAQEHLVHDAVGKQMQPITAAAYSNPGNLVDLMSRSDGVVADMSPALGTPKSVALTNTGRQDVLKSAIQGLLDRGQVDEAQKMTGEYASLLTPDTQRYFQSHITVAQVAQQKAQHAGDAIMGQATAVLGRPPTMEERKVLLGLAKPTDPNAKTPQYAPTPAETIAAFEASSGRPATEEERKIAFGLAAKSPAGGGNSFGNSLKGRAMSFVDDNAASFAAGVLSPEQDRHFQASAAIMMQPQTRANPDTGVLEQVPPVIPPYLAEAYKQRNLALPSGAGNPTLPGQGGAGTGAPAAVAGPGAPAAIATPAAPGPAAAAAPGNAQGTTQTGHPTIWGLNGNGLVTGVTPAIAETAHRAPGVGGMLPGEQMTEARNYVELQSRQLVNALQQNPRYSAVEAKEIEKELDILPRSFDNKEAYGTRLIAVDNALADREAQASKRGSDMSLDSAERQQSRNVANHIHNFREILGVPPTLTAPQVLTLPPGSSYRKKGSDQVFVRGGK